MTSPADLHVLLDDGEPHCSCGASFRGQHYQKYVDHALAALRGSLRAVEQRADIYQSALQAANRSIYFSGGDQEKITAVVNTIAMVLHANS